MVNKPSLKLKILRLLIQHKQLSQTEVMNSLGRNDHGNISQVCNSLDRAGLIEICDKKFNRGRPEIFYKVTKNGVRYLIENSQNPTEFWISLILLVYYQKNPISLEDVLELFDVYLKKYLTYYLKHGYYSLQLDAFNSVCDSWFEKAILRAGKIPPAQKVLEVLAINPDLTLNQISQFSGEKVRIVESIIKMFTVIPHKPVLVDAYGHHDSPFYDTREWRFQIHKAIVQSPKGTISLTIFGLLMVLYIILKNEEGNFPQGLMYKYDIQENFNKIVNNYKSKIPLIFGKWSVLKSCLKDYAYLNFKVVLDKKTREKSFRDSVQDGGSKELYIGMKEIIVASQRQLIDLQTAGINVIFNFQPEGDTNTTREEVWKKIQPSFHLFLYLTALTNPAAYDSESFMSTYANEYNLGAELAKEMGSLYDVSHLERSLSLEISFIYYMSLVSNKLLSFDKFSPESLKDMFTKSINSDKEIEEFIHELLTSIKNHYLKVQRTIGTLY
jgi:DNA-binding PadR family transcriptional regulator